MNRRLDPRIIGWMLEHPAELRAAHLRQSGPPDLLGWMMLNPDAVRAAHEALFGPAKPSAPSVARASTAGLTEKQGDAYRFICDFADENGCSPTFSEIMVALDLKSKGGVYRLLDGLEERGRIRRLPNRARAIEIVEVRP